MNEPGQRSPEALVQRLVGGPALDDRAPSIEFTQR